LFPSLSISLLASDVLQCTTLCHLSTALRNNLEVPATRLSSKAIIGADVAFCQLVSNSLYKKKLLQLRLHAQTARRANFTTNVISLKIPNRKRVQISSPQKIRFVYTEWFYLKSYPNKQPCLLFLSFHIVRGICACVQNYGGEFLDV